MHHTSVSGVRRSYFAGSGLRPIPERAFGSLRISYAQIFPCMFVTMSEMWFCHSVGSFTTRYRRL